MSKDRQRLDKVLAHLGYGTRKEIKKMLKNCLVTVNGERVKEPGLLVFPYKDKIQVDGQTITYREFIYILLNKPQGVLSATEDRFQSTVLNLLPSDLIGFKPFPVGRLDKDTEGLLLLTNDGKLAHRLLAPKKQVPKTYYVQVEGLVTEEDRKAFQKGITLEDGYQTRPGILAILQAGSTSEVELTIYEGKFHQVKRMFLALGKKVTYLKRLTMGPLSLDPDLKPGMYRELSPAEVELLSTYEP